MLSETKNLILNVVQLVKADVQILEYLSAALEPKKKSDISVGE